MKKKSLTSLLFGVMIMSACSVEEYSFPKEVETEIDYPTYPTPSELIELQSGVVVERRQTDYFYERDIILTAEQLDLLNETGSIFNEDSIVPAPVTNQNPTTNMPQDTSLSKCMGIKPNPYNLWAMVRFVYGTNLNTLQKNKIKNAIQHIESTTNVRFYNATGLPTVDPTYGFAYPYIEFIYYGNKDISDSKVGRIGGKQQIRLADFAFNSTNCGVIIHEICHALGMLHEPCRTDRDNYVTINTSNLTPEGLAQFNKRTKDYYCIGEYDYNSVMGYSSYTSSYTVVKNEFKPMYTKKDGTYITQGTVLSPSDRKWLNALYLPYVARSDSYMELDKVVYNSNNEKLSESERLQLQSKLNNGVSTPPSGGRIPNNL